MRILVSTGGLGAGGGVGDGGVSAQQPPQSQPNEIARSSHLKGLNCRQVLPAQLLEQESGGVGTRLRLWTWLNVWLPTSVGAARAVAGRSRSKKLERTRYRDTCSQNQKVCVCV